MTGLPCICALTDLKPNTEFQLLRTNSNKHRVLENISNIIHEGYITVLDTIEGVVYLLHGKTIVVSDLNPIRSEDVAEGTIVEWIGRRYIKVVGKVSYIDLQTGQYKYIAPNRFVNLDIKAMIALHFNGELDERRL